MKSYANKKKKIFFSFYSFHQFFCVLPCHVMTLDYSDENGNVSGGESEDDGRKNEEHKEHRHSQDNEISTTASHHDHNEIEKSTSIEETTTTTTTMKMEPKRNQSMPCDADNGGCDHECRMVIDEHDVDPRIQCSCYIGYTLDDNDGRRCHGKINFSTSFRSFFTIDIDSPFLFLLFLFILDSFN